MALPVKGSTHLIPAYYSFIDPERMKGWVGWPVADGLPTLVVTHQLQVERRTGKVRRPETDVLPLSHATRAVVVVCNILSERRAKCIQHCYSSAAEDQCATVNGVVTGFKQSCTVHTVNDCKGNIKLKGQLACPHSRSHRPLHLKELHKQKYVTV